MFLDQQAKLNNHAIGLDGVCGCVETLQEENKKLKEENEKLKELELTEENAIQYVYDNSSQYDDWVKGSTVYQELKEEKAPIFLYKAKVKELREENEKLKTDIGYLKHQKKARAFEIIELRNENEKLKERNEDLHKDLNNVDRVPWNSNYTDKAILEFIGNCSVNIVNKICEEYKD